MRLIDASKLIEAIENHDFGTIKAYGEHSQVAKILVNVFIYAVEEVVKIVKTQPTAYDVDEVIKEFQKESYLLVDECYKDGCVQVLLIEDAIDIVKRGSVE